MDKINKKLCETLVFSDTEAYKRGKRPARILLNGKYLCLGKTNKTIWPSKAAAKIAFSLHCKNLICHEMGGAKNIPPDYQWGDFRHYYGRSADTLYEEWMNVNLYSGFLQFIEIEP